MIAYYLKARKPRSKVIILDSKDSFTMQRQFQSAWNELYPNLIEWVGLSQGGNVTSVEVASKTFVTDFDKVKADVANVIPPQKAGAIAHAAGVADRTGWCPVEPVTFKSPLQRNIHVIGDAAIAGAMPKSAFAANEEGKICAHAIVGLAQGRDARRPKTDQRVLQPACAGLRDFHFGRVPAGQRTVHGSRRHRRDQSGRCAALTAGAGSEFRRCLVQDHHARDFRMRIGRAIIFLLCGGAFGAWPGAARNYRIVGDEIPQSLTGKAGDRRAAARLSAIAGLCLLCHSGPFPEERFQGDLAPDLAGAGDGPPLANCGCALSMRAVSTRPRSCHRITRPMADPHCAAFRGKPILSAEQIEDVIAYLMTLKN